MLRAPGGGASGAPNPVAGGPGRVSAGGMPGGGPSGGGRCGAPPAQTMPVKMGMQAAWPYQL